MSITIRGFGRGLHFLWPDEALFTDDKGRRGDWQLKLTAGPLLQICGPKSGAVEGFARGKWPAPSTLGSTGPAGPVAAPAEKTSYVSGTTYAANDTLIARGMRWIRTVSGTQSGQFSSTNWVAFGSRPGPYHTRSGEYLQPQCIVGITTNGTLVSGQLSSIPVEIGPRGMSVNALAIIASAQIQVGGATTMSLALYPDDGTTGTQPDWSAGPVASATIDLTTAAGQKLTTGLTASLSPGIYHAVSLYVVTTAPTTVAQVTVVNSTVGLPSTTVVGVPRAYIATGLTALPNGSGPVLVPTLANNVPMMALRSV